ncbi:peptide chain release factor N(5)-glutamine methyltransferase [Nocardioides sp.]|uniref:peptide chain release factor N(5)-glutamine methyltransferase n=1 Tax=Nocardioides sp. TaxID=35761 RepID=UPI002D7E6EEB|nr:peptide chain release factor N(5)-glutamine methyltransferase [Nocardioides sp.]HET8961481.1 peptide chain release factor N(5)-glutamine methyltransferase [Nocardioides sp.]
MTDRRSVLADATGRLAEAGVPSPEYDAAELLAHVLGTSRAGLFAVETVPPDRLAELDALIDRRAGREPLQHLTGTAHFRHVTLAVGPGVFVPRPETELLAGWAIEEAGALDRPVVLDLGTGSGAIAAAVADEVPAAEVHALELDQRAHAWAQRNLAGTGVDLRLGDLATAFDDLVGRVDVIASNPPYIPLTAWESVAPEARDHDPELALWSGADGLDAIRALEARAAVLLRQGGWIGVEHADAQGETAPEVFTGSGRWSQVKDHRDLADRPRFLTARLAR